jgi:hypothetical protein
MLFATMVRPTKTIMADMARWGCFAERESGFWRNVEISEIKKKRFWQNEITAYPWKPWNFYFVYKSLKEPKRTWSSILSRKKKLEIKKSWKVTTITISRIDEKCYMLVGHETIEHADFAPGLVSGGKLQASHWSTYIRRTEERVERE